MAIEQRQRQSNGFGLSTIGERTGQGLGLTPSPNIPRENVSITLVSAPDTLAPGETGQIRVRVENTASSIPSDDPFFCRDRNGVAGVAVTVDGAMTLETVGDPTVNLDPSAMCSTPGETRLMSLGFTAPSTTGTYRGTITAGWHDPPQVWSVTREVAIQVQESNNGGGGCTSDADCGPNEVCQGGVCVDEGGGGCHSDADCGPDEVCQGGVCVPISNGGGGGGGGGEQLFGLPRDQVLLAGGLAGLGLGAAALLS